MKLLIISALLCLLAGAVLAQNFPIGLRVLINGAPFVSNNPNLAISSGAQTFLVTGANSFVQ